MLTATQVILASPGTSQRSLTLSGNEMMDYAGVSRLTGTQGDGASIPGGVGVWPAATNRCINGNATTNTTGITDNSSTTSRVTSGVVKFGATAFSVISSNLAANEGPSQSISGGAASTAYSVSAWVWLTSGAATVRATLSDDVTGKQGGTAVVLTATPQRVTVSATTGALSTVFNSFIETTVQAVGTWRIGGWQVETGSTATPYIETDGATAARSDAGIAIDPTGLLTPTQGWIAYRLKMGWSVANEASPGGNPPFLLMWSTDGSNRIYVNYAPASDRWEITRDGSAISGAAATAALTFALGDEVTIVVAWDATTLYISFNGGAFVSAAHSSIPSLPTTLYLASWANTRQASSEVRWIGMGRGTLTNADAAALNGFGNTPPIVMQTQNMLSHWSRPTYLWDARTGTGTILPAYYGGV